MGSWSRIGAERDVKINAKPRFTVIPDHQGQYFATYVLDGSLNRPGLPQLQPTICTSAQEAGQSATAPSKTLH